MPSRRRRPGACAPVTCPRRPRPRWTCSPNSTNGPSCACSNPEIGGPVGLDHSHDPYEPRPHRALRIGVGGPVGSGKTALVAALCRLLRDEVALAVVTNDIYTTEDADFLRRNGVLDDDRIAAVRTGCCPHTAIRDDISANLDAVEA